MHPLGQSKKWCLRYLPRSKKEKGTSHSVESNHNVFLYLSLGRSCVYQLGPPPYLRDKSYLMSLNSMVYKSPKFFLSKFPGNLHIQSSLPLGLWFCICWATLINMSLLKFYNVNTLYFSKDFSGRKPVGFVSQTTSNGTVGNLILENLHCRLPNNIFHCDKIYIAQNLPF